MYIQILRQVSQMQWGISKNIFNTNHSLPQLVLITWFLLSQVWMLLFKLPLFKTVAAHTNCGIELRDCFLLQRPPRSALCRGLQAPASWGSPPSQGGLTAAPCAKGNCRFPTSEGNGKPSFIISRAVCIPGATYHTGFFCFWMTKRHACREELLQASACWLPM